MFLNVFCKSSTRYLALLYYTEKKPGKKRKTVQNFRGFSKNFPEIAKKSVPPVVYYKYLAYRMFLKAESR